MRVMEYTGQEGRKGKELMGTGEPEEVSRGTWKALESAPSNRCITHTFNMLHPFYNQYLPYLDSF